MTSVNIRTARQKMSTLIEEVAHGNSVTITKRGREVARIVPVRTPERAAPALPDLSSFRKKIAVRGTSLAQEVAALRREERA